MALKIYSQDPDWSVADSSPSGVLTGEEAVLEGALGFEKEEPKQQQMRACVFAEDELLADLSLRNPLVANEVSN